MLVSQNNWDKSKSIYKCDRCEEPLTWKDKIAVYIGLPSRAPKKKWDLCERCYNSLVRGIEKGVQKK